MAEELDWMAELSRRTGRPFSFNLQQIKSLGTHYRDVVRLATEANETGANLRPQITPRSVGVLFSLAANTLLDNFEAFQPLKKLDLKGRLAALADSELRQALISQGEGTSVKPYEGMYLMPADQSARYDFGPEDSIAAIARTGGVTPIEAYIDAMLESEGRSIDNWPVMNEIHDAVEELVTSPVTIMGLADSGAHATQIMDASQPTYFLQHWVRECEVLTLEEGVKALTSETADFIGYQDRGRLTEGSSSRRWCS